MIDRSTNVDGRCTCGAVRYRLKAKPLIVHCCHCTWCQRESGSAFAVNAVIEAWQVKLQHGQPVQATLPSASGKGQVFWRCADCGVTLWSNYPQAGPRIHFIRVGTLEEPARVLPDIHIYTRSRLPWVRLPEGALAVDAYYDSSQVWPPASLERRKALFG